MRYGTVVQGIFLCRPNRFIAQVLVNGKEETVHVKNTGRCRELLVPGAAVYLEVSDNPARKTKYDLIAVVKDGRLINMDSQMPNGGAAEWVAAGGLGFVPDALRREVKYGNSRFDLWFQRDSKKADFLGQEKDAAGPAEGFVEVKGVTLENQGIVRFPDAPTERGLKHIRELGECVRAGYEAYVLFVVQMSNVKWFEPNDETMPAFGRQLREARSQGVHILAVECHVTPEEVRLTKPVPLRIGRREK